MWLFTTIGFFSVVKKDGEQHLTVRSRSSADLDRLRTSFMPELSATLTKKGTDYPYRATLNRQAFAKPSTTTISPFSDNYNSPVGMRWRA